MTELADRSRRVRPRTRRPLGGVGGNETLTSTAAALLTILLLAEGLTILHMNGLLGAHMFIGLMLIPPVLLKLASTGYRFARYYTGSPTYRAKGPPQLPLRLLAPVLVASTLLIFATGIWLMLLGHHSNRVVMLHKVAFIVWGAVFAVHFLAYLPRVVRALAADWTARTRKRPTPGARLRAMLVASSLAGGIALALALLSIIHAWGGPHRL